MKRQIFRKQLALILALVLSYPGCPCRSLRRGGLYGLCDGGRTKPIRSGIGKDGTLLPAAQ
jgi:hypothetical protein